MNLRDFDLLGRKDFQNGAVLEEIRTVVKQRDALLEACKTLVEVMTNGEPPDYGGSMIGRGSILAKTAIALCEKGKE